MTEEGKRSFQIRQEGFGRGFHEGFDSLEERLAQPVPVTGKLDGTHFDIRRKFIAPISIDRSGSARIWKAE
jgi:hypothetical protein